MADERQGAEPAASPDDEPRLEDLPGRPIGPDEIDPELIALPRTRARIGPILSLSIVIFCSYILAKLYDDLRFSRQGPEPDTIGSMAEATDPGNAERFVQVGAVPDRSFAVRVAKSKADPGSRLAPVQGSNGKLWLMMGGNVWTAGIKYEEVYRGRLRQVSDLPFVDALESHIRARGPEPRFLKPDQVARAMAQSPQGGEVLLTDPAGDSIAPGPDTAVHIYEEIADQVRIRVFGTEKMATSEAWVAALSGAGLLSPDARPQPREASPDGKDGSKKRKKIETWTFIASVPGGAGAARSVLREKELFGVLVEPIGKTHQTTWRELISQEAGQASALSVSGARVPWSNISWIALEVSRELSPDAMVLLTRESPETYWFVLPLFAALGLFGLLFVWALVRAVRAMLASDADAEALAARASS